MTTFRTAAKSFVDARVARSVLPRSTIFFAMMEICCGVFPSHIESCNRAKVARWLSRVLHLLPVEPRPEGYSPLGEKHLDAKWVARLGVEQRVGAGLVGSQVQIGEQSVFFDEYTCFGMKNQGNQLQLLYSLRVMRKRPLTYLDYRTIFCYFAHTKAHKHKTTTISC